MRMLSHVAAVVAALVLVASSANAAVVSWDLSYEFSGATPPEGAAPWLTATFDDGGWPG